MTNKITTEEVNAALEDLIHTGTTGQNQLGRKAYRLLLKLNNWLLIKSDTNSSIEMHTDTSVSTHDDTSQHKF